MAVQIINDMPDAEVHRGEPVAAWLRDLNLPRRQEGFRLNGRAAFMGITIALHLIVGIALLRMQFAKGETIAPAPIEASIVQDLAAADAPPPAIAPPPMNIVYSLPTPQEISIETTTTEVAGTAITSSAPVSAAPPLVESVEYLRAAPPVYPRESQRRREHGTVLLRVLVDAAGRPAQIQVERSSGFERLDVAARQAVEKFLFRPHEVNGVPHPAQVLIPIEFERRG